MKENKEREGEIFIFLQAALWGLFPVITILSFKVLSPLVSLGWSSLFATLFFAVVISIKKKWHEIKNTSALKNILWATFFIGIISQLLYFFGLRYTSAGNAAIIALTETLFSYLFFHVFRKDYFPKQHIIGSALMIVGAFIVLFPNTDKFRFGDILILCAVMMPPIGNFFQQKARKMVSSESMMFVRSLISTVFVFFLAYVFKTDFSYSNLRTSLPFVLINGILLLGLSKIFWIEGIHRISVTKSNALASVSPLLTLLFAWLFLHNSPTIWQMLSFVPMFFGILLLSKNKITE
jgi:drug/metabolite transporter (DMT)-like permease